VKKTFVIDYLPESAHKYCTGWAIAAVDVIRATTMAITAVSLGRKCYPVDTLEAAVQLRSQIPNPLLAGELQGEMPTGFHMNNSPAQLAERDDIDRPLIMLSSSGTRLMANGCGCDTLYLGCFRNAKSLGDHLAQGDHDKIAMIGAGSRGEFREEDQIGCAWIAAELVSAGYVPQDKRTTQLLDRWSTAKAEDCLLSKSIAYLQRTDQIADLYFILERINDLDDVFVFDQRSVTIPPEPQWDKLFDAVAVY
jgi:2-phosphosulfolactate phosphatase